MDTNATMRPSLDHLRADVIELHNAMVEALRTTLTRARELGTALIKLKAKVKSEGLKWAEWLDAELPISHDCAIRYMRISRKWETIEPELNRRPGLTLKQALQFLADGKPKQPPRMRSLEDIEQKMEHQMLLVWLNRQSEAVQRILFRQTENAPLLLIEIIEQYLARREAA